MGIAILEKLTLSQDVIAHLDEERDWREVFSETECKLLNLARAFLFNADIMCFHKPLANLDAEKRRSVASALREHVLLKGIAMPCNSAAHRRRPRTVFITSSKLEALVEADCIYHVDKTNGVSTVTLEQSLSLFAKEVESVDQLQRHISE